MWFNQIALGGIVRVASIVNFLDCYSYKYLSNFANKIGLYCNDNNEYLSLFDHSTFVPDEVPGRCILEIEKRIIECQTYLAFEGNIEKERVENIRSYIQSINEHYPDMRAKQIPSIPNKITNYELLRDYNIDSNGYSIAIGLTYENVEPQYLNISEIGLLGLCGKENTGHRNFIRLLLSGLESRKTTIPTRVVVMDDFARKLEFVSEYSIVDRYILDSDSIIDIVADWSTILENRYNNIIDNGTIGDDNELLLLIIQNNDVAKKINDNWDSPSALFFSILRTYGAVVFFVAL